MAGEGIMNSHGPLDRAAMVLGGVSIVSSVFVFLDGGNFQLVQIRAAGLVVAVVLGVLAVVAGWFQELTLILAAGAGFLLAAALQVALLAGGSGGFLGGNASAFSLWLGLGIGLIVIGAVPRPETSQETFTALD
jgi:hypothetical protein